MEQRKDPLWLSKGRGVTLNDLRSQQYSLNMQMLLAMQIHDEAAQKRLTEELTALQERIDQFCMPECRRRE